MTTVVKAGTLIEGSGNQPLAHPVVVIEGDKITAVGTAGQVSYPQDAEIVDLGNRTLLPGLVDAHVHMEGWKTMDDRMEWLTTPIPLSVLRSTVDARKTLEAGFTLVRCVGGPGSIYLKQAIDEGVVPGPHIMSSGRSFNPTGGPGDNWDVPWAIFDFAIKSGQGLSEMIDGPDGLRQAVRRRAREKADLIKFLSTGAVFSKENPPTRVQFTMPEMEALVDEAHRRGMMVACHAHGNPGIRDAVLAGVDTIEHGTLMEDDTLELMLKRGTYLVPTFTIMSLVLHSMGKGVPEYALRQGKQIEELHHKSFLKAYKAGLKIVCGTDLCGPPPVEHGKNAMELELLVEAGMTPMDAIVSATGVGATACGLGDKTGTITPGKWADMIAVDGDPLKQISILQSVPFVMKGGRVFKNTL